MEPEEDWDLILSDDDDDEQMDTAQPERKNDPSKLLKMVHALREDLQSKTQLP